MRRLNEDIIKAFQRPVSERRKEVPQIYIVDTRLLFLLLNKTHFTLTIEMSVLVTDLSYN